MSRKSIIHILSLLMMLEAACMLPALCISLYYREGDTLAIGMTMGLILIINLPVWFFTRAKIESINAREGFAVVALGWIFMSVFGAMPYMFSKVLPRFEDALFEAASGFTTTGASVLLHPESAPHGILFWRAFTHWIGGMGVLVLTLALLPRLTGNSYLMRAESPGPSMSKIVPKMRNTAIILYMIYAALTLAEFVALLLCGMTPFDAFTHAMSTAGTGGFSNYLDGIGAFHNSAIDIVVTVFMFLFGINFALYYRMLIGRWRDIAGSEELKWYVGLFVISGMLLSIFLRPLYENFGTALRYGYFQTAALMSTTGFSNGNILLWPQAAQGLMVLLLFVGGCAGSTAGGLKIVRVALLCKSGIREIRRVFQPRKVQVVRFEGKSVEDSMISQIAVYFFIYILLIMLGAFLLSLSGCYDFQTHFTAAVTCLNNVGPGLSMASSAEGMTGYPAYAKFIMTFLMLSGRLEILPMLAIFHPALWNKRI